jgi:hypothetical protein
MALLRFLLCAAACLCLLVSNAQGYDPLDWVLEPIGEIIVQGTSDAIVFSYSAPVLYEGNECSVSLFEHDCITVGGSAVYLDMVDTTSVERELTSYFRIDTDTIKASSYYTQLDPYRGSISFCTKVDCTLNGESYNFHETQLQADFDWTLGFVVDAALASALKKEKTLESYTISLYPTDGDLSEESLEVLRIATELFLEEQMNTAFKDLNNTVELTATIISQTAVTTEGVEERLRRLRTRSGFRSLTENVTGSEVEIGLNATFANEPAPDTADVDAATEDAFIENSNVFVETLTNTSAASNSSELTNITEIAVPEKRAGGSNHVKGKLSLGNPVDAFFCDASSNLVPDPVISQGDTIQVCVRLSQNSSYFHLEDIYMMALTQPTTGVEAHYAVYQGNASALASSNCELGMCNILSQVPSRFFNDQDSGPVRIAGVALLNLGPDERRVLAPIEFSGHRQLQTTDVPKSAFELEAEIIGSLEQGWAPTNNENSDINITYVLLLASATSFVVTLVLWCWLRKQDASRTPLEPRPMQPTPSMKVQKPMRSVCKNTATEFPASAASTSISKQRSFTILSE